jgi:hypothetical protein
VGAVYGNVTIKNNAAINPSVTGIYNVNRVIGAESPYNDGTTTALNNFARSALTSGFTNFADGNEYSGTGKTDGAFLQKSTYETGLGWKFGNGNDNPWVWRAFEDYQYPTLYWQTQKP